MKVTTVVHVLLFTLLFSWCCNVSIDEGPLLTRRYMKGVEWNPNIGKLALLKDEYSYSQELLYYPEHYFNIFLTGVDGVSFRQLSAVRNKQLETLKWSPSGGQILYMNFGPAFEIGVVDTLGNMIYRNDSSFVDFKPVVDCSPDGSQLVIVGKKYGSARSKLFIISLGDGLSRTLFDTIQSNISAASWSGHDAIAFAYGNYSTNHIAMCRSDGSGLQVIDSIQLSVPILSWSPDGTRLIYTDHWRSEIWEHDLATSQKRQLTQNSQDYISSVRYSPDGAKISYSTVSGLFIMNSDGTNVQFVSSITNDCSWSPDSRRIVYIEHYPEIDSLRFKEFPH